MSCDGLNISVKQVFLQVNVDKDKGSKNCKEKPTIILPAKVVLRVPGKPDLYLPSIASIFSELCHLTSYQSMW